MDYRPFPPGAPADDGAHNRNEARDSLFLAAQLRLPGEAPITVRVRNLSAGGLMAEVPMGLTVGEALSIEVRGVGWVAGRVAWTAEGRIGIAFDQAIDPRAARKPVGNGTHTPHYTKPLITRLK